MTQHDKDKTRGRYLRMAAKLERRKENEARRPARSDDDRERERPEDSVDDWSEEDVRRAPPRDRRAKRGKQKKKRERETVLAHVVGVARGLVRLRLDDATDDDPDRDVPLGKLVLDGPLAIGDELDVEPRPDGPPRIVGCRPRRSALSRPDPGNKHKELLVAANVDVGVIVAAAASPPLRPGLIDRYLIALERGGVAPLLCINKLDLCTSSEDRRALDEALAPYVELERTTELSIVRVSAASGEGIEELRTRLAGQTAVFVGHSGVGKSSTLNALAGRTLADAGDVREFDGRGRHTTTASTMYRLEGAIRVIDTAGIRVFGLYAMTAVELRASYPGIAELGAQCRFSDCAHVHEDGCAVRAAVDGGAFSAARYAIYARMLADCEDD